MLKALFNAIDNKDSEAFAAFITESGTFKFGNMPVVTGRNNIKEFVKQFFDGIQGISHQISESWRTPNGVICHGTVTYIRHDQTELSVPFANILKVTADDQISEYLIFADVSELFAA